MSTTPHRGLMLHDERGFTLVELLVAATIAGVGFLGLAATHAHSIRATAVGRNTTVATQLAAEQIEVLRRVPYGEITTTSPAAVTRGAHSYSLHALVSNTPGGNAKRVAARVAWTDQFGPHQVELLTVVSP